MCMRVSMVDGVRVINEGKEENLMKFQYEEKSESLPHNNVCIYTWACQMKWFMGLAALQPLSDGKGIYDEKFSVQLTY